MCVCVVTDICYLLLTGVLILLSLGILTPYFYFIPKASLAAVIICAVIFMIEYEVVKPMWRSSRKFQLLGIVQSCALALTMWRALSGWGRSRLGLLGKIFWSKGGGHNWGAGWLHNEELHGFYFSSNITLLFFSRASFTKNVCKCCVL